MASASAGTAALALTLTWQASPNPRTRRTRNTARAHQQQQQHRFAPPSISYNGIPITDSVDPQQQQLDDDPWCSSLPPPQPSLSNDGEITAILPLSMERILLALPNGSLTTRSLAHLANTSSLASLPESDADTAYSTPTRLQGRITHLQQLHVPTNHSRRNRIASSSPANAASSVLKLVVGTTEEGELLLWDAATLTLFAELPLFACPIQSVILLDLDSPSPSSSSSGSSSTPRSHSRLNGSLACAATDGTLAILHLDLSPSAGTGAGPTHDVHLSLQHIIPSRGPSAPLQTLFLRNAELLLLYADTRARLWDTASTSSSSFSLDPSSSTMGVGLGGAELRRSIGAEQAESLVEDDNKAFEGLYGAHSAGALPRPTSLFAPSSSSSQPHPPPPPVSASHFAGGHLAPPPTARSGLGTPDSGRPRFAAASHAAHALLGLNGGVGSPFASRTASGTASPNPAGPVVPTQRWVAFDFTAPSASTAAAAGVLSFLEEYEEGAGEGESFTLRADFRRAIEAAAKALIPKGAPSAPAPSSSSAPHGKKKNVALSSPAAVKALGILGPVLVVLLPSRREGSLDEGEKEVEEAWGKLGELVGVDTRSLRAEAEGSGSGKGKGKGRPRLGQLLADRGLCVERDGRRPPSLFSEVLTTYIVAFGAILRVLSRISDFHDTVDTLRHAYVDPCAQFPPAERNAPICLDVLSLYFLDPSPDIRATAKSLLHAAFRNLPQPEIDELCRRWESALPSRQSAGSSEVPESRQHQSIMLLGLLGSQRYKLLPPTTLKDVASSITKYLHAPQSAHELHLALELIIRGFTTWQHYFDAMEVMRTLFWLSTNADQPSNSGPGRGGGGLTGGPHPHPQNGEHHSTTPPAPSIHDPSGGGGGLPGGLAHVPPEIRALARRATLHIAGENTPLFMTTLSHDILHARSAAHCSATMRLVTFLVRQEPLILLANLPRLAEAVVKSLDPTVNAMREAVLQAATAMISDLVHTYPSIDFHGGAQRLAVGTHEGACILYDVKTATRLYVLEGHAAPVDACAFSPDGRRLVTISHGEAGVGGGRALVWKIGQSLASVLLMPGQMPRQGGFGFGGFGFGGGGGGGEAAEGGGIGGDRSGAYRAVDFGVSEGARRELVRDPLGTIRFEWGGEEGAGGGGNGNGNVRVRLGEVSLSFSVA